MQAATLIHNINADQITNHISKYAVLISVFVHISVFGIVKLSSFWGSTTPQVVEESYIDLGYETLDEIPVVKPVVSQAHEIQDEKSEVVGLQKKIDQPIEKSSTVEPVADIPYYKIKPKYPKDALESGVEGYVNLSVDILEDGTVENIEITGGQQLNLFEVSAKRAVAKWKYRPFLDDSGRPIRKKNHLVRVDFKLSDEIVSQ